MTKKLIMNDETRRKLSGLLPCTSDFSVWVTPDIFEDIEDIFQPSFQVKPFNNKQLDKITKDLDMISKDDSKAIALIKTQIIGWRNLILVDTGEQIEFEADTDGSIKKEQFDRLPKMVQSSLVASILNASGLKTA